MYLMITTSIIEAKVYKVPSKLDDAFFCSIQKNLKFTVLPLANSRGRETFQPERLTKLRKIEVLAWPGQGEGGALLQKLISDQFVNNLFSTLQNIKLFNFHCLTAASGTLSSEANCLIKIWKKR